MRDREGEIDREGVKERERERERVRERERERERESGRERERICFGAWVGVWVSVTEDESLQELKRKQHCSLCQYKGGCWVEESICVLIVHRLAR